MQTQLFFLVFMPDRRIEQVGHRKIGYCGHVPKIQQYDCETRIEVSIHPLRHGNIERRVAASKAAAPISAAAPTSATVDPMLARLSRPSTAAVPTQPHKDVVPPPGYGGHRQGSHMQCGGVSGTVKVNETDGHLTKPSSQPKWEPLPAMSLPRGPVRQSPLGFDVFLTS